MRTLILWLIFSSPLFAQQYLTKNGEVRFFSKALIEDIQAVNEKAMAVIDLDSGEFAFKIGISDFVFPNSLMQEHFNESYLESHKYPHSTFTGTIEKVNDMSQKNDLTVRGNLIIHGISQEVTLPATMQQKEEGLHITSSFFVALEDYDIDIPKIMMYKIAEEIEVTVDITLQKRNNE